MKRLVMSVIALPLLGAGTASARTIGFATLPPGAINNVQAQVIA